MKIFWIADFGLRIGWCVASMLQLLAVFPLITISAISLRGLIALQESAQKPSQPNSLDLLLTWSGCGLLAAIVILVLSRFKRALLQRIEEGQLIQSKIQNPQSKIG